MSDGNGGSGEDEWGRATALDRKYATWQTVGTLLRDLGDPVASAWLQAAARRAEQMRYGLRELIIEPSVLGLLRCGAGLGRLHLGLGLAGRLLAERPASPLMDRPLAVLVPGLNEQLHQLGLEATACQLPEDVEPL